MRGKMPISHSCMYLFLVTAMWMYGSYVLYDMIVWENINVVHFSCDIGKYSTCPMNNVFDWRTLRITPYSLDECCIFPYRTQMNTVCISSHTLHSDFHYETYIGISPYRTLAVGLYSTCQLTPYSLDECCIFPYRTHMNTVCIYRLKNKCFL